MTVIVPPCAVVTSPVDGRVGRLAPPGTRVDAGEVVAVVAGPRGDTDLYAPVAGHIGGALADEAQAVATGEGVVWLSRH